MSRNYSFKQYLIRCRIANARVELVVSEPAPKRSTRDCMRCSSETDLWKLDCSSVVFYVKQKQL